jgi:hypothetical protein
LTPSDYLSATYVRKRVRELASERQRFGYRQPGLLLARGGIEMKHKKLHRLWREERLVVPQCGGRKRTLGIWASVTVPRGQNQRWSLDFLSDALADAGVFVSFQLWIPVLRTRKPAEAVDRAAVERAQLRH